MFTRTYSSIMKSFTKQIDQLRKLEAAERKTGEKLVNEATDLRSAAADRMVAAADHKQEANRAANMASRIEDFIS